MYLDPGSGSVILQAILAAVLGAGIIIKLFWRKVKSLFGKHSEGENDEVEGNQE